MKIFEAKLTNAGRCVMIAVLVAALTLLRPYMPFEGSLMRILTSAMIGGVSALVGAYIAILFGLTVPATKFDKQE